MKTLQEIKDEVAKEQGYFNYRGLVNSFYDSDLELEFIRDKIAKRYAEEAIQTCAEDYASCSYFSDDDKNSILAVKDKLR